MGGHGGGLLVMGGVFGHGWCGGVTKKYLVDQKGCFVTRENRSGGRGVVGFRSKITRGVSEREEGERASGSDS